MSSKIILEILLSTKERRDLSFLEGMFPSGESGFRLLIVNQSLKGNRIPQEGLPPHIRVLNIEGEGLSRSRNFALKHAEGDILLLSDDDVRYFPGFAEQIKRVHRDFPDGLIVFPMKDPAGNYFGKHSEKPVYLTDVRYVYSPQISMKRDFVLREKIRFDERFGLGAAYPDAENYVLLMSLLRRGIRPLYAGGEAIVEHEAVTSSHRLHNPGNFKTRLAVVKMFYGRGVYSYFLKLLLFLLRKRMISFRDIPAYYRLFREVIRDF